MDSRERVKRAVEFRYPDRIPFEWYKHGEGEPDLERSDLVWVRYKPLSDPLTVEEGDEIRKTDEWGCTWVSYKSIPTMGQPLGHPLREWSLIEDFEFPGYEVSSRFEGVGEEVDRLRDLGKYLVGTLDFGLWERLHFLRGAQRGDNRPLPPKGKSPSAPRTDNRVQARAHQGVLGARDRLRRFHRRLGGPA